MKGNGITVESAQKIAQEYLRTRKNLEKPDISTVEQNSDTWVFRGTCAIDLEGHPWAEKFEIIVDTRGKVRSTSFALL